MTMICKAKCCHNVTVDGEKYCKYHLAKKAMTNRKILIGVITAASSLLLISDKIRKKHK